MARSGVGVLRRGAFRRALGSAALVLFLALGLRAALAPGEAAPPPAAGPAVATATR